MTKSIMKRITEGKTKLFVYTKKTSHKGPGTKDKLPFYNPAMELNRDLSVLICQWLVNNSKKHVSILDGLAASGVRGTRFANEVDGDFEITVNDWNADAFVLMDKNIKELKLKNTIALNCDLNSLLYESKFDYIDVDPFGSPVRFIDSAVKSISHNGLIACTATDTATLCGVYPKVCLRRYSAQPFHSPVMKEVGLRILIGILCREAGKYDKGIQPILSYTTDHYFRIYVRVKNGISYANESIKNISTISSEKLSFCSGNIVNIGPLWTGALQKKRPIQEIRTILSEKQLRTKPELWKLLDALEEESTAPMFFYSADDLASMLKTSPPKMRTIFEQLKSKGYTVCRTHFSNTGFKTNAPRKEIEAAFTKK